MTGAGAGSSSSLIFTLFINPFKYIFSRQAFQLSQLKYEYQIDFPEAISLKGGGGESGPLKETRK